MKTFSITDIGKTRRSNQDYVFCHDKPIGNLSNLFIVADGMGGHNAGEYASKFCVEFFVEKVEESTLESPVSILQTAIKETNDILLKKSHEKKEMEGMGTTFVVATISGKTMYVANIGDSRLYHMRDEMEQITEDHSLVEVMIRTGEIAREEAKTHPKKNVITRALGGMENVRADFFEVTLKRGDIVLMCSDGLTNMIENDVIEEIIKETPKDVEQAALSLVDRANSNGGKDNIAIIILKV